MSGFSFSFSFGNRNTRYQRGSRFQYSFGDRENHTSRRNNARTFDQHMRYLLESVLTGPEEALREVIETGRFHMHSNRVDLQNLEKTHITESDVKDEKKCAVCLCEYERNEEVVVLPCKHMFHESCIKPWLKDHRTCPTCRKDVTDLSSSSDDENLDADGFSISDVMEAIRRSTSTPDTEESISSKIDESDESVDDHVSEEEKRQIKRAIEMSLEEQQNQETRHRRQEQFKSVLNFASSKFTDLLNTILPAPTTSTTSSSPSPVHVEEIDKDKEDEDVLEAYDEDDAPPGALEAPVSVVLRVWLPNGFSVKTQTFTQSTSLIDVVRISLGHQYQDATEYVVWNKFPRYPFRDLSKSLGELNLTDLSQVAITRNGEEPTFSIRRTTR